MNLDKDSLRKYLAELVGTFVLVVFGCGTAVVSQCSTDNYAGYAITALAFGLAIVAMAYSIGNVSGCHVNPAVSLAMLIMKKMSPKDFAGYVIAQFAGAIIGAAVLMGVLGTENGLGANSLYKGNFGGSFVIEVILTFVFVFAIIGVTSKAEFSSISGLVIGFSLTLVHLFGIGLTGTSVNPARSFGPALLMGGDSLAEVWVFIVAPLIGAVLAAVLYQFLYMNADEVSPAAEPVQAPAAIAAVEGSPAEEAKDEAEAAAENAEEAAQTSATDSDEVPEPIESVIPAEVPEAKINGTTIRTADLFVTLPKQTAFSVDTGITKINVAAPTDEEEIQEVEAIEAVDDNVEAVEATEAVEPTEAAEDAIMTVTETTEEVVTETAEDAGEVVTETAEDAVTTVAEDAGEVVTETAEDAVTTAAEDADAVTAENAEAADQTGEAAAEVTEENAASTTDDAPADTADAAPVEDPAESPVVETAEKEAVSDDAFFDSLESALDHINQSEI